MQLSTHLVQAAPSTSTCAVCLGPSVGQLPASLVAIGHFTDGGMDAGVVAGSQDAHLYPTVVSGFLQLPYNLCDLSVGPSAKVDFGHPLLFHRLFTWAGLDHSVLRVIGVVRIFDEKTWGPKNIRNQG